MRWWWWAAKSCGIGPIWSVCVLCVVILIYNRLGKICSEIVSRLPVKLVQKKNYYYFVLAAKITCILETPRRTSSSRACIERFFVDVFSSRQRQRLMFGPQLKWRYVRLRPLKGNFLLSAKLWNQFATPTYHNKIIQIVQKKVASAQRRRWTSVGRQDPGAPV